LLSFVMLGCVTPEDLSTEHPLAKGPRTRLAPGVRRGQLLDVARGLVERRPYDAVTALFVLMGLSEPDQLQDLQMWGWLGLVERVTTRRITRGGIDRAVLVEMLLDAAAPLLAEDR
jgi:hypothetical protein